MVTADSRATGLTEQDIAGKPKRVEQPPRRSSGFDKASMSAYP
jgi:hypothetical protein